MAVLPNGCDIAHLSSFDASVDVTDAHCRTTRLTYTGRSRSYESRSLHSAGVNIARLLL